MPDDTIYEDAVSQQSGFVRHGMAESPMRSLLLSASRPLSCSWRPESQAKFGSSHRSADPIYYRLPLPARSGQTRLADFGLLSEQHHHNPQPIPEMANWELPIVKRALLRQARPDRAAALLARNVLLLLFSLIVAAFTGLWVPEAYRPWLRYISCLTCAIFVVNIAVCIFSLAKPRDQCFDLPLTPRQRQLLDLLPAPLLEDDEPIALPKHHDKPPLNRPHEKTTAPVTRPTLLPKLASPASQVTVVEPHVVVLQRQRDLFAKHFSLNLDVDV